MMEKVRKISKRYYVRQMVACWLVLWMGFGLPLRVAMAIDNRLPSGEVVVPGGGGVGEFDRTSFTDQLHIRDVAHQTIIEWDSFNIGSEALTEFHQIGDINPAVLNRVTTGGASEIFGDLIANGRVFVINPAGIIFGSSSSVNVNQLVASSLDIANGDFRDGLPYTFTGGATAGNIIHESPTTITAEQIVLIGQQVINRGSLVADDYVIMAAGETVVLQADPGVSNIAVVVTMPEQTPGAYDYYVDNGEGPYDSGNGDIDADHVILAAGDIWSMAITGVETLRAEAKGNVVLGGDISAYSDGGSDAVADVTIITGGDFTANHEIMAVAEATGGLDNASASVLIDSDGNVIVNDLVKAEADAENGAGNATATVDIIADGDVTINEIGGDEAVHADAWVEDSGDGTATLTVSAGDNVYIYDFIKAEAETFDGPSGNMSATVDIDAGDDIVVQDQVLARAYADDHSGNASATVNIDAGLDAEDDVLVDESGEGYIYADAETYNYSGNATSLIDVGAGGDVTLYGNGYLYAYAYEDGDAGDASSTVDIETGDDVTVDEDGYILAEADTYNDSGGATALVDIYAGGDVTVVSEGMIGSGYIWAYAYNDDYLGDASATIEIDTVGSDVIVNDDGYIYAEAYIYDYAGNATALVDIDAGVDTGGNVIVDDNGQIYAYAYGSGNVGDADADVDIDAGGNVTIENDGYIYAYAETESDSGGATADVDIDAGGDVTVVSEGQSGSGYIWAYAYNSDYLGDATATVDIEADNVTINDWGYIYADAYTYNYAGNATALVDIDAGVDTSGNVIVDDDGYIYAYAWGEGNVGNASGTVDIDAGGNVTIDNDGYLYADAYTYEHSGNATADVDIDAGGDVTVVSEGESGSGEIYAYSYADDYSGNAGATVDIDTVGSDVTLNDSGYIYAYADAQNNSGNATADVDIDAGVDTIGDVTVDDWGYLYAEAYTTNDSGDATAIVDIDTGGSVYVYGDGYLYAEADAQNNSGNADADVDVDAGGDVTLVGGIGGGTEGHIYADAEAQNNSGDADADVYIEADNVTVDDSYIYAEADAQNNSGNATALVDIDTVGSDVTVNAAGYIYADARAQDSPSGNASATVDIDAGNVTVNGDGDIEAEASTKHTPGNATALVDIDASGNVTLNDSGDIKADADTHHHEDTVAGDADATVDIVAGNVTVNNAADILAEADAGQWSGTGGDATATTNIDVGGGAVTLNQSGDIKADAYSDIGVDGAGAEATVDIKAGSVALNSSGEGTTEMIAKAEIINNQEGIASGDAIGTVNITASGTATVTVDGEIIADSDIDNFLGGPCLFTGDAISVVDIDSAGDVIVAEDSRIEADADIDNYDNELTHTYAGNADADVYITALGVVTVDGLVKARADVYNQDGWDVGVDEFSSFAGDIYSGNSYANVWIDNILGLGVTVGPEGEIVADSQIIHFDYPDPRYEDNVYSGNAYAGIDIESCGDVIVDGLVNSLADIWLIWDADPTNDEYSNDTYADVIVKAFGDVIVNSGAAEEENGGSNGQILAEASDGKENSAGVTVLAVGNVIVNDGSDAGGHESDSLDSQEEIMAAAHGEEGSTNNAFVGIATRDGDAGNVEVSGQIGARTWIEGEPGSSNTSNVEIYADQDLIVYGGYAEIGFTDNPGEVLLAAGEGGQITAEASNGSFNTANVDIYADRDVIVHGAELEFVGEVIRPPIVDGYYDGGQILALTWGRHNEGPKKDLDENTSSVGIYAQRDVTINEATIIGEPPEGEAPYEIDGQVLAGAHGLVSILDADVVICAQDDVTIDGKVIAEAGTSLEWFNEHYADIVIAAGNVDGDPAGGITGTGWIYAEADPSAHLAEASILLLTPPAGNILIPITNEHFGVRDDDNPDGDGLPDIDQTGPVDCPECDFEAWDWIDWEWCEDCETPLFAIPIVQLDIPRILGCPLEMAAAALELGVAPETIQVSIGDALALNPTMQPCQACATLLDAAAILRDEDGSRMAAMNAVFNELAPSDAPFTPEMGASIVTAFAGAAEGSQYASVAEYIDAFVRYFATVEILGSPVEDSLAFVMEKYGTDITESENSNLAAFVATRLEAGETFAQ